MKFREAKARRAISQGELLSGRENRYFDLSGFVQPDRSVYPPDLAVGD